MYRLTKEEYKKISGNAITSSYIKANGNLKSNEQGKEIIKNSFNNIIDKMDIKCWVELFYNKEHTENFLNHPKVCLINPTKNELGRISKTIFDNINMKLFQATKINQWKNSKCY